MADASSGLMQPLWAPQPNIYNSGITRGGRTRRPEAGGDPNGSITANRGSYQTIDNIDTPNEKSRSEKYRLHKQRNMVLLRLIGVATKLLTTYRTLSDNKDTQTRNTYCKIIETHTFRM